MENQTNTKVITISDLWNIFLHRLWALVLVAILAVSAVYTGIKLTYVPRYSSTATLYILQQNHSKTDGGEYEDFNLALKVVNDCRHLLKSHSVLDQAIKELNLNLSYHGLYKSITISNPADSRILEVSVESDSPELAKEIVDKICDIGTKKITEAMGFEQVNFYERGILDPNPCNGTSLLLYFLVGIIAVAVTYSIFLITYVVDDNIGSDEEIKQHLNVSILGDIPNFDETKKRKKYGRYSRYGKGYYRRGYYGKGENR